MDVSPSSTHSESQPSTAKRTGPDDSQEQNSVTSGETGRNKGTKLGPLITAHKGKGKDGPKNESR